MDMIIHDCPHCETKGAGLMRQHPGVHYGERDHRQFFEVLATCMLCGRSVVATLSIGSGRGSPKDASLENIRIKAVAPKPPSTAAPAFTPENVARFFEQGMENLPRNWDAAGTMFRKALEAGLKNKWPEIEGRDLYARIEKVAAQGGLTDDMKDWAHQIRDDGNDAAHEDQPMEVSRARALADFTRLFLLYTFSLPGMLREAKEKDATDAP